MDWVIYFFPHWPIIEGFKPVTWDGESNTYLGRPSRKVIFSWAASYRVCTSGKLFSSQTLLEVNLEDEDLSFLGLRPGRNVSPKDGYSC